MKLPDRTISEFLKTPLTPMALLYLDTSLSTSLARTCLWVRISFLLYLLASLTWLNQSLSRDPYHLAFLFLALGVPLLVFSVVFRSCSKKTGTSRHAGDVFMPGIQMLLLMGLFWMIEEIPKLMLFGQMLLLTLLIGSTEFALRRSIETRLARQQLDPVPPKNYLQALKHATRYPDIERFRQSLVMEGRDFLTHWEYAAIVRYDTQRMTAYDHAKASMVQRRFFHPPPSASVPRQDLYKEDSIPVR